MTPARIFVLVLATTLSLAACTTQIAQGSAPNPAAETPTDTVTPAPTVSVPTATPGSARPTATRPPATDTPIPSPTTVPSPTPHVYTVEAFDTLLGIAIEFDTTVEALMAANDIGKSELLQIGQELVIPSSAPTSTSADSDLQQTATLTATNTVTATTAATATKMIPVTLTPAGAAVAAIAPPPTPLSPTPTPSGPPIPTVSHPPNINPLTGLPVDDPARLQHRPILVRVGNDVGARPQVGLNSAEIVYEEITEWWVTRFTAIFLEETPDTGAPIRSARLMSVQLAPQYQGALAHSGGSDPVRWEISQAPLVNLDEYFSPQPYFYRPNQGWQTRLAVDVEAARNYLTGQGTDTPVDLQGFVFSDSIADGEPAENIYIPYPRATSFTEWRYEPAGGKYLRWINGSPLNDFNGGQIAASNVIVYFAKHQDTDIVEDSTGATSIRIIINGRGPAWFFRDGKLNKGFWQTDGARPPYFTYEDGRPYALKPGNAWVEVVPTYFQIGLDSADEASSRP